MTDANCGGSPAEPTGDPELALETPWEELQVALAAYLGAMADPDECDHLLLEVPGPSGDHGCPPYVQFAGCGEGRMVRAEVSGNHYLSTAHQLGDAGCEFLRLMGWRGNDEEKRNWYVECSLADAAETARQVVSVLRDQFGVPHPALMSYQAWGPKSADAAGLGLCASDEVPVEVPWTQTMAFEPEDCLQLRQMVRQALHNKYGCEPRVDDDEDFVLEHLGQPVWVRVHPDQPAVVILARVAHGVYSGRATAVELGILNRDSLWVRWSLHDRTVWQTLAVPGLPFVPSHLDGLLDTYFKAMSEHRDDLVLRTRGRVA